MSKLWMKPAFGGMLSLAMLSSSAAVWAENLDTTDLLKRLESLEGQLNTLRGQNENLRSSLSELRTEDTKPTSKLETKDDSKEPKPAEKKEAALAKTETDSKVTQAKEAIKPSAAPLPSVKVDPNSPESYYTYGTGEKQYETLDEVSRMLGNKKTTIAYTEKPKPAVKPTPPPQSLATQANTSPLPDIQRSGRGSSVSRPDDNDLAALGMAVETIPTPTAPPRTPSIAVNPDALALADNALLPSAAPMPSQPSLWGESQVMSQEKVIRNAYDSAYKTMLHNPAAAIPALRAFVRDHHNHPLAAQAQYWVGEALFGQRDYGAATEAFMRVLKNYKTSEHAPDAALKLGYSFYALKQWEFARRTLEDVTRFFPNTPASQMAIGRLEMMSSEGH